MADNEDVRSQLHDAIHGMLIDKVRRDRYPSATMMNMIEAGLDDRLLPAYARVLFEKVSDDKYPSTDMLKRLTNLA